MLLRLMIAFIGIPLIELYLLLQLASATSVGVTLGIVVLTGMIGSLLARREGAQAWRRFRECLASGRTPTVEIRDGLMIAFAAALLLTPGIITDVVGFALLTAPGRHWFGRWIGSFFRMRFDVRGFDVGRSSQDASRDSSHPNDPRAREGDPYTVDASRFETKH
ncbi:MAG: FxsA family protein [Planctomycetota bacterium]